MLFLRKRPAAPLASVPDGVTSVLDSPSCDPALRAPHILAVHGARASDAAHAMLLLAGETVALLPDRALWWPAAGALFVADVHVGKAATFRARGLPVPAGTTHDNLERLSALLARHGAARLVVLGDFLHAAESHTPSVLAALAAWRMRWPRLEITLVRGNHDNHAGDPPAALGFEVVDEPHLLGPFAACHHPQLHGTHHVLCGHVHPAVHLRGRARDVLRLPCFSVEANMTVLPAFGAFTGTHVLRPAPARTLYAVGAERVWRVPTLPF